MRKILAGLLIAASAYGAGTPRETKLTVKPGAVDDVTINHKAYSSARWTFTLNGVDLTDYGDVTVGIKTSLSATNFWALGTGTVSEATAGKFYIDWTAAQWATNISSQTRFYGDIRFEDFDIPLPSLDIRLKPAANWGNETYAVPTRWAWQTNGTSVGQPTVVNLTTNLTGVLTGSTLEIYAASGGAGSQTPWTANVNADSFSLTNGTAITNFTSIAATTFYGDGSQLTDISSTPPATNTTTIADTTATYTREITGAAAKTYFIMTNGLSDLFFDVGDDVIWDIADNIDFNVGDAMEISVVDYFRVEGGAVVDITLDATADGELLGPNWICETVASNNEQIVNWNVLTNQIATLALLLTGGTMSGTLDMGDNNLTNVLNLTVDNGDLLLQSLGSQSVRFDTSGQVYDSSDNEIIDFTTHTLSSNAGVWEVEGEAVSGNDITSYTTVTGLIETLSTSYVTQFVAVAASDETTDLTTGTGKVTFNAPYAMTVVDVYAGVVTAPVGSTLVVDINEAGATILSTKISIDASETWSGTAATPPVISDSSIAAGASLTVDLDQIGASTSGAGLKVYIVYRRN